MDPRIMAAAKSQHITVLALQTPKTASKHSSSTEMSPQLQIWIYGSSPCLGSYPARFGVVWGLTDTAHILHELQQQQGQHRPPGHHRAGAVSQAAAGTASPQHTAAAAGNSISPAHSSSSSPLSSLGREVTCPAHVLLTRNVKEPKEKQDKPTWSHVSPSPVHLTFPQKQI